MSCSSAATVKIKSCQISLGSLGFRRFGLHRMSCMETFYFSCVCTKQNSSFVSRSFCRCHMTLAYPACCLTCVSALSCLAPAVQWSILPAVMEWTVLSDVPRPSSIHGFVSPQSRSAEAAVEEGREEPLYSHPLPEVVPCPLSWFRILIFSL